MFRTWKMVLLVIVFLLTAGSLSAKKNTISFWHILGYHAKPVLDEMIAAYNEEHTGREVKPDYQGFYEDAQAKLLTAAVTGRLPDVAQVPLQFLQSFIENGLIESIDKTIPEDMRADIGANMWKLVQRNGATYGLPFCVFTDVFFCNEKAFLDAGLDPGSPPATWDEMISMGRSLTRDSDGDGLTDIYAMTFYTSGLYGIAPILWAHGGSFFTDNGEKINLTSDEMLLTMSLVHDLVFRHRIMPQKWTDFENAQAFLTGRLAMGWFISPGIPYSEENLAWPLKISHMPLIRGRRRAVLNGTALVNFAKGRKRRNAVNDFTFWLTGRENDIRFYKSLGFTPIRRSAHQSLDLKAWVREHPNYRVPLEALEYAKPLPNHPQFMKINEEIAHMLERILLEEADLEEELESTEQRINEFLLK